ncbi:MAG: AAA family ATPase [Prevotellaceae bacterium]|nr:AAA family ATPase [Candidatus Colivivens equi]
MRKFRYPVDTDQFQKIREQGKLYVDKTDMMYELANEYEYVFLARPRRFGKSLLCNTFKAYFKGQKELFEGLKVMELEKEWKTYPVLHFDMSDLKNCTIPEAKSKLGNLLRDYEKIYGREASDETPGARFRTLIHHAEEQTGEKVVVILDEYDSPIMRLLYEKEQLEQMRSMLREFYQVLKKEGAYLRFVFITGVTKFSQLSIFSELNNLRQISMDDDYSGICGITQEELDTTLRPCVEEYAENLDITTNEAYALLKKNYDGYHFSPKSKDVYAPFSLLRAFDGRNTGHYWFESGTSKSLIEHLQHHPEFNPLDFDGAELSINAFNVPCENASTPIPLLYQSGYLTIASYDKDFDTYTLHFPNYEVRQGMVGALTSYLMDSDDLERDAAVLAMARALKKSDLSTALIGLRSWIASLPYDIITKKEWMAKKTREAFYKLILYVVFSLLNSKVDTEVKSILGRADVVIKTDTDIFVLELKVDDTVENALAQIDDKGYAIPYEADGRKVTKCGVSISSEQRNITNWRIVSD